MKLNLTQKILAGVACLALYSIPLATINGAFDIFMKTETTSFPAGEYSVKGIYDGWIRISSFNIGGKMPVTITNTGTGFGEAELSAMKVEMLVEQTSPAFFQAMTTGALIPELKLALPLWTETTDPEIMRIYLKNASVESINWSAAAGGDPPFQSVSLLYEAIKVEYNTIEGGNIIGTYSAEWDIMTGKAAY